MTEMDTNHLIDAFLKAREPLDPMAYIALLFLVPNIRCVEHIHAFWDADTIKALIKEAVGKRHEPLGIMGIRPGLPDYIEQFNEAPWVLGYIRKEISHVFWQKLADPPDEVEVECPNCSKRFIPE
jgi:hypothetical protein